MGTAGTFDSENRLKDKEEWVTCRKCGLEYPKNLEPVFGVPDRHC